MIEPIQQHDEGPAKTPPDEVSASGKGIGALLKEERERRGLSYGAVAERTRLRAHFLEALEKEEWDTLPPPAFLKGFLRTYARLLLLDEKTVLDLYARAVPSREGTLSPPFEKTGGGRKPHVFLVLCMLFAVAALVFGWKEYLSRSTPPGEKESPVVSESRKAGGEDQRNGGRVIPGKETVPLEPPPPETPRSDPTVPQRVPETPAETVRPAVPPASPADKPRATPPATTDRSATGEHVLRAHVSARTWMRIQIDDSEPRDYMFQPRNRAEWKARHGFYLVIVNAGAVQLTFDGEGIAKL